MTGRRVAWATLLASALLMVGVVVAWRSEATAPPRADLVTGDSTSTPTSPPPTTAPDRDLTAQGTPARRLAVRPAPAPAQLVIPSIGVDVPIRPVGIRADGGMEIPSATEAGWFSPGPHPTAPFGSSVLAAHIDYGGRPGAFFHLREIQVGQRVTVRFADGSDRTFQVTERTQVPKAELRVDEVFRTTGPPVLTLVTCGGAFDRSARHYRDNIVVHAVPV